MHAVISSSHAHAQQLHEQVGNVRREIFVKSKLGGKQVSAPSPATAALLRSLPRRVASDRLPTRPHQVLRTLSTTREGRDEQDPNEENENDLTTLVKDVMFEDATGTPCSATIRFNSAMAESCLGLGNSSLENLCKSLISTSPLSDIATSGPMEILMTESTNGGAKQAMLSITASVAHCGLSCSSKDLQHLPMETLCHIIRHCNLEDILFSLRTTCRLLNTACDIAGPTVVANYFLLPAFATLALATVYEDGPIWTTIARLSRRPAAHGTNWLCTMLNFVQSSMTAGLRYNPNLVNAMIKRLLKTAVSLELPEVAQRLIAFCVSEPVASLNQQQLWLDALYLACQLGNAEVVQVLAHNHTLLRIDLTHNNGSLLHTCATNNPRHAEVLSVLLSVPVWTANHAWCALTEFVRHTCVPATFVLLQDPRMALALAAEQNEHRFWTSVIDRDDLAMLDLLLSCPLIDPNTVQHYGPLTHACSEGHVLVIQRLISDPARINVNINNGYPLRIACRHGHIEAVKMLLTCPQIKLSIFKNDAILGAVSKGHTNIVSLLLHHKEAVIPVSMYTNLFQIAVRHGVAEMVALLQSDIADRFCDLTLKFFRNVLKEVLPKQGSPARRCTSLEVMLQHPQCRECWTPELMIYVWQNLPSIAPTVVLTVTAHWSLSNAGFSHEPRPEITSQYAADLGNLMQMLYDIPYGVRKVEAKSTPLNLVQLQNFFSCGWCARLGEIMPILIKDGHVDLYSGLLRTMAQDPPVYVDTGVAIEHCRNELQQCMRDVGLSMPTDHSDQPVKLVIVWQDVYLAAAQNMPHVVVDLLTTHRALLDSNPAFLRSNEQTCLWLWAVSTQDPNLRHNMYHQLRAIISGFVIMPVNAPQLAELVGDFALQTELLQFLGAPPISF